MNELRPRAKEVLQSYCEATSPRLSSARDHWGAVVTATALARARRRRVAIIAGTIAVAASLVAAIALRPGGGLEFVEQETRAVEALDQRMLAEPEQAAPATRSRPPVLGSTAAESGPGPLPAAASAERKEPTVASRSSSLRATTGARVRPRPTHATPTPGDTVAANTEEGARVADTLGAEAKLMAEARVALRDADDARLLRLLARHRAEFPAGALIHERKAWETIARCRSGKVTQAKRDDIRSEFVGRHPASRWTISIERVCGRPESQTPQSRDGNVPSGSTSQ